MKSEVKIYRAINFDLKIKLLKQHYPKKNFLYAYKDIKLFMIKNDFSHRQWSGYRSNTKISDREVRNLLLQMKEELSWLDKCSTKIDLTNIGKMYDIKEFFASFDTAKDRKDIEKMFEESEIKISNTKKENKKVLDEQIRSAKQSVQGVKERKVVSAKQVRKSYDR